MKMFVSDGFHIHQANKYVIFIYLYNFINLKYQLANFQYGLPPLNRALLKVILKFV